MNLNIRKLLIAFARIVLKGLAVDTHYASMALLDKISIEAEMRDESKEKLESRTKEELENFERMSLMLDLYKDRYKDLIETLRSIEVRAQWLGAFLGVMISAMFTLSDPQKFILRGWLELIFVIMIVLISSLVLCKVYFVIRWRSIDSPHFPHTSQDMELIFETISDYDKQKIIGPQLQKYAKSCEDLSKVIDEKSNHYSAMQIMIILDLLMVIMFVFMRVK